MHSARFVVKGAYVHLKWHDWKLKNNALILLMQRELLQLTEAEAEGQGHC